MKKIPVELMGVSKEEGSTSTRVLERLVLKFSDAKKLGGVPNDIFTMVVTTMIANFDVSKVLDDGCSSCDIVYSYLFEKMGLKTLRGNFKQNGIPSKLNLKYHNVHDEPVMINADLFGEKRIYKALKQD